MIFLSWGSRTKSELFLVNLNVFFKESPVILLVLTGKVFLVFKQNLRMHECHIYVIHLYCFIRILLVDLFIFYPPHSIFMPHEECIYIGEVDILAMVIERKSGAVPFFIQVMRWFNRNIFSNERKNTRKILS